MVNSMASLPVGGDAVVTDEQPRLDKNRPTEGTQDEDGDEVSLEDDIVPVKEAWAAADGNSDAEPDAAIIPMTEDVDLSDDGQEDSGSREDADAQAGAMMTSVDSTSAMVPAEDEEPQGVTGAIENCFLAVGLACYGVAYVLFIIVVCHALGGACKVAFAAVELALGVANVSVRVAYSLLSSCCETGSGRRHGEVTERWVDAYDTFGLMRKGWNGIFHGVYIILPYAWFLRNIDTTSDQHSDNMDWWDFYTVLPFKCCPEGVCCDEDFVERTVWVDPNRL